jgi:hypothetical protein
MKIKNILILVLIMTLLATGSILGTAPEFAYGSTDITNPRDIVIAQPGLTYTTSHKNISIYGASDWEYPLDHERGNGSYHRARFFRLFIRP